MCKFTLTLFKEMLILLNKTPGPFKNNQSYTPIIRPSYAKLHQNNAKIRSNYAKTMQIYSQIAQNVFLNYANLFQNYQNKQKYANQNMFVAVRG